MILRDGFLSISDKSKLRYPLAFLHGFYHSNSMAAATATVDLEEAAELVLQAYERCYDLEIAFSRIPLSEDDKQTILQDDVFKARVQQADYDHQEDIISTLIELKDSEKDNVRFQAAVKLGELFYERRFRNSQFANAHIVPDSISLIPGPEPQE